MIINQNDILDSNPFTNTSYRDKFIGLCFINKVCVTYHHKDKGYMRKEEFILSKNGAEITLKSMVIDGSISVKYINNNTYWIGSGTPNFIRELLLEGLIKKLGRTRIGNC